VPDKRGVFISKHNTSGLRRRLIVVAILSLAVLLAACGLEEVGRAQGREPGG
jgi:hypothetical protein